MSHIPEVSHPNSEPVNMVCYVEEGIKVADEGGRVRERVKALCWL